MRDWQIGPARVDIYRCDVDLDFGGYFLEIEAADAVSAEAHAGLEFCGNPSRVLADFQREGFGINNEAGFILRRVGIDLEVNAQFVTGTALQRVLGTRNVRGIN